MGLQNQEPMQISTMLCQCPQKIAKGISFKLINSGFAACVDMVPPLGKAEEDSSNQFESLLIIITYDIYEESIKELVGINFKEEESELNISTILGTYRPSKTEEDFCYALDYLDNLEDTE